MLFNPGAKAVTGVECQCTLYILYESRVKISISYFTATYPLDLTKTRLQIQGEISGDGAIGARRGMVGTAVGIGKSSVNYK